MCALLTCDYLFFGGGSDALPKYLGAMYYACIACTMAASIENDFGFVYDLVTRNFGQEGNLTPCPNNSGL